MTEPRNPDGEMAGNADMLTPACLPPLESHGVGNLNEETCSAVRVAGCWGAQLRGHLGGLRDVF